jgi:hypothetical protein
MDPATGLAILGSAAGGAKTIEKILGPTAEHVGVGLKNWTEHRVQNVARIFRKAAQKLGPDIETPGVVSPKVLKEVLDEGSYSDDELTTEYFGGILASGRTPNGRDDRAASTPPPAASRDPLQSERLVTRNSLRPEQVVRSSLSRGVRTGRLERAACSHFAPSLFPADTEFHAESFGTHPTFN